MLNAFSDPLCSKLYWHNRRVPRNKLSLTKMMLLKTLLKVIKDMMYSIYFKLCTVDAEIFTGLNFHRFKSNKTFMGKLLWALHLQYLNNAIIQSLNI